MLYPDETDYEKLYYLLLQRRKLGRVSLDQFSRVTGDIFAHLVEQELEHSPGKPSATRRTFGDLLVLLTHTLDIAHETDRLLQLETEVGGSERKHEGNPPAAW